MISRADFFSPPSGGGRGFCRAAAKAYKRRPREAWHLVSSGLHPSRCFQIRAFRQHRRVVKEAIMAERRDDDADGPRQARQALTLPWAGDARAESEEGARGRGGRKITKLNIEAKEWPGLEQALRASKRDVATSAAGRSAGSGAGAGSHPTKRTADEGSAKRGEKPSPLVTAAFGFPAAPPVRRAATVALQRISALALEACSPPASPSAAASRPRKPTHAKLKPAATGADGAAGSTSAGSYKRVARTGAAAGKKLVTSSQGATSHSSAVVAKKIKKVGSTGSKATSEAVFKAAATDGGGASTEVSGGRAASSGLAGGHGERSKNDEDKPRELDSRVFRFVEAGACQEEGCEFRDEVHCHRGPGCDCVGWPAERDSVEQHQEHHLAWNSKPAFGKWVVVKFDDNVFYAGTIYTKGNSEKDLRHANGRWGVVFDDCTRDRFQDGDIDVMISTQPMPTEISEKLYTYYLRRTNGAELLELNGVKTHSSHTRKGGESHKRHKSSEKSKSRKQSTEASRDQAGGASAKLKHAAAGAGLARTSPEAASASAIRASDASGSKKKRKHSMATEDEETDVEVQEHEVRPSPRKEKEESREVARRDDDEGGSGKLKSGSGKDNNQSKKYGAGHSGSGAGGIRTSSSRDGAKTMRTNNNYDHIGAIETGNGGHNIGGSSISMTSKVAKQPGEKGGVVRGGEAGDKKRDEHGDVRGPKEFNGGDSKHKKCKNARRGQQESSNDISSRGNGDRGDARAEDKHTSGSVYPHQYERDPEAAVLAPPDSPNLNAMAVAEGGGGAGENGENGEDETDGKGPGRVSPTSHAGAVLPSPNVRQEQSPPPPPQGPPQIPPQLPRPFPQPPAHLSPEQREEYYDRLEDEAAWAEVDGHPPSLVRVCLRRMAMYSMIPARPSLW